MPEPGQSLADLYPEHAAEWDTEKNDQLTAYDVIPGSYYYAWWKCGSCGKQWGTTVSGRVKSRVNCRKCNGSASAGPARPEPGQSLGDLYPDHAAEWDMEKNGDLTPFDVKPKSESRVWWKCGLCGKSWEGRISVRADAKPHCKDCRLRLGAGPQKPAPGQSFGDLYPEHAKAWDSEKNKGLTPFDVKPKSTVAVWWRCAKCDREWHGQVWARAEAASPHCPECAAQRHGNRRRPGPGESLAERYPDHAAEWDTSENRGITPHDVKPKSRILAWWKCGNCGTGWGQEIFRRTQAKANCKACRPGPGRPRKDANRVHPHGVTG